MTSTRSLRHPHVLKLIEAYKPVATLIYYLNLGGWDMNTYMPPAGIESRAQAAATLSTLIRKLYLDYDFKRLVESAKDYTAEYNSYEAAVYRRLQKALREYELLPDSFLHDFELTTSKANLVWAEARKKASFSEFAPTLEKVIDLCRRMADYLGYQDHPYDALVDTYEEGWTTASLGDFFASYRSDLKAILGQVQTAGEYTQANQLSEIQIPVSTQKIVNTKLLKILNADLSKLRLDTSAHPFSQSLSNLDSRITTRYQKEDFLSSITSTIHEFGHALYDLQSPDEFEYTPLQGGTSLGIHESQSRFWENIVGRSREFIEILLPVLSELSPDIARSVSIHGSDVVYKHFNRVSPSFIRVEADEITYHFHIMLRYELEVDLISGKLSVYDLPEAWNAKMQDYLGVTPDSDDLGVLQDVHWSMGAIGYFATYSLGTFLSAQWKHYLEKDLGPISSILLRADGLNEIKLWLREHVHSYGSAFSMQQLVKESIGEDFNTAYFLDYLREKYTK